MILSFFHDHNFMVSEDVVFTTGTLSSDVWSRYLLDSVDKLLVCARRAEYVESQRGRISSREKVEFVFSPSLSNVKSLLLKVDLDKIYDVVKRSDLIIARLPSEIGLHACAVARELNKPYICEVVGCPFDALVGHGSLASKVYAVIAMLRMRNSVLKASANVYVTASLLQTKYPSRGPSTNISNVEIDEVLDDGVVNRRVKRFFERRADGRLKVGLIGSVKNNIKGVDVAIRAMTGVKASLHVIGSGDPVKFLRLAEGAGVSLKFDGFHSDPKSVIDWLDDIDIYIQPSSQEGLPRATIEAMSRGCPVLSSDAGGLVELTLEKYIHKKRDYRSLNKHIESFIKSGEGELTFSILHSLHTSSDYVVDILNSRRSKFLSALYASANSKKK